ncbi:nuclear transport factor 2 family protein [Flavobacterium sp.]|uniref:nuclear transport factor 2 family protein n=1 Tax=Flavobacterium sp. TaxID=239 RepID=UPI0012139AA7|nr:nuclear transport factor 2 family protein [Flavobacterium sp.]RZJ69810.1 MAG: nuclear transport factor 2 family protein [Flavobacterium sp.]
MNTNKSILEKANLAVTNGDNEGFLDHCTEDVIWHFIGDQKIEGKEAVRQYMQETYLEPPQFDVEDLIAEGDLVTAVGKIALKDESGEQIKYDYCDVWRFRDGKMCELRAFVLVS